MPPTVERPAVSGSPRPALWKRIRAVLKDSPTPVPTPVLIAKVAADGVSPSRGRVWAELEIMTLRGWVKRVGKVFDEKTRCHVTVWEMTEVMR